MPDQKYEYGILLPHFGSQASATRILEGAQQAERAGFDAVWVRDHLVYRPHAFEDPARTFLDPFVVLSAVAGVTETIILATGALIPHRNPVHTALLVGSLDFLAGPHRIILGFGLGSFDHEFSAAGMSGWDRRKVIREQVQIMRLLWEGREVSYEGDHYRLEDIDVHPPPGGPVPIWYCGTSPAAVRRAVEYCDGWIPGRMPRRDYRKRVGRMRRLAEEAEKPLPVTGTIPYVVPGRTAQAALQKLDLPAIFEASEKRYMAPESGAFSSLEDLDGSVIAGTPETIIEEVRKCQEAGALHVVFDLRAIFDEWEEALAIISEEVLPVLKREDR